MNEVKESNEPKTRIVAKNCKIGHSYLYNGKLYILLEKLKSLTSVRLLPLDSRRTVVTVFWDTLLEPVEITDVKYR